MRLQRSIDDVPPQAFFVGSAVFHYLGPAFAVLLFARVDVLGVAWLRIASAAIIFACWRRPWRTLRALDAGGLRLLAAWGAVLAIMNVCFYEAIARLPLATVAAIEFVPVIVLAAAGARTRRNASALALAVLGVYFLTDAGSLGRHRTSPSRSATQVSSRSTSSSETASPSARRAAGSTVWPARCWSRPWS
jgi:inner membrane transporter RhtA